jgi:hypothetical protein
LPVRVARRRHVQLRTPRRCQPQRRAVQVYACYQRPATTCPSPPHLPLLRSGRCRQRRYSCESRGSFLPFPAPAVARLALQPACFWMDGCLGRRRRARRICGADRRWSGGEAFKPACALNAMQMGGRSATVLGAWLSITIILSLHGAALGRRPCISACALVASTRTARGAVASARKFFLSWGTCRRAARSVESQPARPPPNRQGDCSATFVRLPDPACQTVLLSCHAKSCPSPAASCAPLITLTQPATGARAPLGLGCLPCRYMLQVCTLQVLLLHTFLSNSFPPSIRVVLLVV